MLKVFGFVRRHPRLTHDEYRAAHVGYHNSFGRRLPNIRGYLLNVRANRLLPELLGTDIATQLTHNEPADFDDLWDGWGQLLFDSLDDYLQARAPSRDRAGPQGLMDDPGVAEVGGDFDHLYAGSPFQFHVEEQVVRPVERPEHKLVKLVIFSKRAPSMPPELFRSYLAGRYASELAANPAVCGLIVNHRSPVDVMSGFFKPDAEGFTPSGTAIRERFYGYWDAMVEVWLEHAETLPGVVELAAWQREYCAACFWREVDETVAVLPNRAPRPAFYHR